MRRIAVLLLLAISAITMLPLQALASNGFDDVPEDHPFRDAIDYIADERITLGCAEDEYCPDDPVTRGEMAAFLVRAFSIRSAEENYFVDVKKSIFIRSINALARAKITAGCDEDMYCPRDPVSREQMATFLVRVTGLESVNNKDYFWDDDDSAHEDNINALAHYGLTVGCRDASFCPKDSVTRGEMAVFLKRALALGQDPTPNPKIDEKPPLPTGGTRETNRQLGEIMASQRDWTGKQWSCLDNLWTHESRWDNKAQNPTSTAYGIAQFLNSTWALVGAEKTSEPTAQIEAGLDYIDVIYGHPCGAWSSSRNRGWY